MDILSNQLTVDVVDKRGVKIDERTLVNTPLAEFYPNEDIIFIDWT